MDRWSSIALLLLSVFGARGAFAEEARLISVQGAHAAIRKALQERANLLMRNPRFDISSRKDPFDPSVRTFSARLRVRGHSPNVPVYVGRIDMRGDADAPQGTARVTQLKMAGAM
jgi:hypothetical protein